MRKLISILLAAVMCLTLCSCGGKETPDKEKTPETEAQEIKETTPDTIIKNATLQYPASNDLFKYNVYDTYVEISEYIGDDDAEEVVVPAKLEDLPVYVIDSEVFEKCNVKSIVFEEGIYRINTEFSFYLESVTLPSTLDFIGYGAFKSCHNLKSVVIPEGIDSIHSQAFMHCDSLKEITVPSTVFMISSETFAYCESLEVVNISNGVEYIEDMAFVGCKSLKTLNIPSSVTKLGEDVFMGSGMVSIEIPESVEEMGSGVFSACESLLEVKVYNADMKILPLEGYSVAILFSQCNPNLVVHGKAASTIAKACATENVLFQVMN